jgi:hypothetical protein
MASAAQTAREAPPTAADFTSHHYSPAEIGELWGLSADTVRRLFEKEAGVLLIGDSSRRGRRRYVTMRIPASVVARVHRKLTTVI